ncbi:glycogenin glucosyltransferase [Parahypoxylon ruwenzoriense]
MLNVSHANIREEQVFRSHYRAPPQKVMERKQPFQPIMSSRHAQRHPPKAINLPTTVYEASQDFAPLNSPKAIFPWETRQTPPSRVFYDDPDMTDSGTLTETSTVGYQTEPATPTTPTIHITPSDSWSSFSLTNAWDEVPEIERYVDAMQKHRRKRSIKSPSTLVLPSSGEGTLDITGRRRVAKVTDFPSEAERPSLPVTPAPIRGGPGVGHGNADVPLLPAAEGVPAQSEWDPAAQLQKLARQQSEALLQKLGNRGRDSSDLPPRSLPFGSEELTSPTYVAQSGKVLSPRPVKGGVGSSAVRSIESGLGTTPGAGLMGTGAAARAMPMLEPSYTGPGAVFEKGENIPRGGVPTLRPAVPRASAGAKATTIPEPSYWGPGPSFEKDENILVAEDAH